MLEVISSLLMQSLKNNLLVIVTLGFFLFLNLGFQGYLSAFVPPLDAYVYKILVDVGLAIILAVSLNLINGITGQFSLGHAGFMGIGAYVAASLTVFGFHPLLQSMGLSPQVETVAWGLAVGCAVVVGGLCSAVVGFLVGLPTIRLKGDYLAIATLGFGEIIRVIIQNTESVGGPRGMSVSPTNSNFFWVYTWLTVAVVAIFRLIHSVKGKALFAIREDEFAAAMLGIDTTRYKIIAFVLGSFFAGAAGGLFAHSSTGYINPSQFDTLKSIEIVVMVVLGGLGSMSGSIIAATILTILPEALRYASIRDFPEYRMVFYAVLLVVMMVTRPQGLLGMKELQWKSWRLRRT